MKKSWKEKQRGWKDGEGRKDLAKGEKRFKMRRDRRGVVEDGWE